MEKKDLNQVKYLGASRIKSLHAAGINTVEQLHETPADKLAQIPTIGRYYAKLIKDAVRDTYGENLEKTDLETVSENDKQIEETKEGSIKQINVLKKRLKRLIADLTPPEKKKKLELFNELKASVDTLMNRLLGWDQIHENPSKKISKKVIKKADALNLKLKHVGVKIKKKKIQKLTCDLQSFSKTLKKTVS